MALYLITGGAGFIGSHLASALEARGDAVRVLDNFVTGHRRNLAHLAGRVEILEGDIRSSEDVQRAMTDVEFVLHQAALPSVPRSVKDPVASLEVNTLGTLQILEAARRAGVKRVVYAASSSAYGDTEVLPKVETMLPRPLSPYAAAKLAGESLMQVYTHVYGLPCVSLRYFNVFGPRQDPSSAYAAVIPRFITRALRGEPPVIFGDGQQTRDFCHVDNVVDANLRACVAPAAAGEVLNIACGERISLLQLVEEIAGILERELRPIHEPARAGDVRDSLAAVEKARRLLDWEPRLRVRDGLRRVVSWYRETDRKDAAPPASSP